MPLSDALRARLESLPTQPGCYIMKDRAGEVVYVGKASNLRSRVRSYFDASRGDDRLFVPLLEDLLGDIQYDELSLSRSTIDNRDILLGSLASVPGKCSRKFAN